MTFLFPSFLWALSVLAIPVIIHLFNFRKTTRVYFSNNRFLKKVKESTTAKRKLKHYLILASRLLFLLFLVLVFAQPVIPARDQQVNHQNIVFYLDNSQSMSVPVEDRRRGFDAGIDFISGITEAFPPDARYRLITNDFAPFSNTYKTRAEIQELLSQARLSPVSRSVQEVKDRIFRDEGMRNKEVFWISDFQKSTAGVADANSRRDTTIQWHLVPVEAESVSNVFIDTVFLDNPFASSGENNLLHVKVRNHGTQDVEQLGMKLTINNIQSGATTITVPKGGIGEATFNINTRLTGLNKSVITFNDFPVTFDNEFYLALNFTNKIRVIEIRANDGPTPVEKVYGNEQVFSYRGFTISNFNYSLLEEADLVVVNGLNTIDQSLNTALREYLRKNGTVFYIPGKSPDVASVKNFLQIPVYDAPGAQTMQELDKPDFSNPFFEKVFEEKSTAVVMPKATPVSSWGEDRNAILRFRNERAFLSRFDQEGTLYVMASPLDAAFTDFYNHALFVPVMYRMAAGSKKTERRLYYTLRESFLTLRLDSVATDDQVKLVDDQEIIPSQRSVGRLVQLDLPRFTLKSGFYKVVAAADTADLLAFNPEKAESLIDRMGEDQMKAFFSDGSEVSIFKAASRDTFSNEIKERYLGTPLWKYALILALVFLVCEVLLIRFLK